MGDVAVIVAAGGSSRRFGGERNKLQEALGGRTVLERSVGAFAGREDVGLVVVAGREFPVVSSQFPVRKGIKLVTSEAGVCRAETVWKALKLVPEGIEWVAVHDGARPLVSRGLIDRVFEAARRYGAAVPGMPVGVTVKEVEGGNVPGRVVRTVPREGLWGMQTPQVMRRRDLVEAFERCPIPLERVTDDVQLLELVGMEVWVVEGEERNLKITTRGDLRVAEMWLADVSAGPA